MSNQHVHEIACTFVVHLLGERLLRGLQWQYSMPYALAALVSDDVAIATNALSKFERWWHVLQQMELEALTNTTCRLLVLLGLQETELKHVPTDIRAEIENWLSCFQSTVPGELVFQHLRRMETASLCSNTSEGWKRHRWGTNSLVRDAGWAWPQVRC
eukprot:2860305-Amphidinium_carterae.2